MTLGDLWLWIESNPLAVVAALVATPLLVGALAVALRIAGRIDASQQVANGGIALGLAAVLVEGLGLAWAGRAWGAEALGQITLVSLLGPVWLLVAGVGVEHVVHPGQQEAVRSRVRGLLLSGIVVGILWLVFSVLRVHVLVFSGIFGFLLFLGALVAVFWLLLRFLI